MSALSEVGGFEVEAHRCNVHDLRTRLVPPVRCAKLDLRLLDQEIIAEQQLSLVLNCLHNLHINTNLLSIPILIVIPKILCLQSGHSCSVSTILGTE